MSSTPRTIGVLLFEGFELLDVFGPCEAYGIRDLDGAFRIAMVAPTAGPIASAQGPQAVAEFGFDNCPRLDVILVPGGIGTRREVENTALISWLRERAATVELVTSVCTGAGLLARTGLLDGRRATTHWMFADELRRRYPKVTVEVDRIFIADGPIWTSAGMTAGLDLALSLVERDLGAEKSREIARVLVLHHRRAGGQSQHSTLLDLDAKSDRVQKALLYARRNLSAPLSVENLAEAACLSPRQFSRVFRAETGLSPAKAIENLRLEAARLMLEQGRLPIESIANETGFADRERMRRSFVRAFGQTPQAIRKAAPPLASF